MAIKFNIDVTETGREFPHYWEYCVGSCHATTILREDVRDQIRKAHKDCGFKYLRFHGLFDDDMSVVYSPMMGIGEPQISFYNIDCIFDFLLEIGMKPFVELGFMPTALASGEQTCFHYKANVTPPKSYEKWNDFIKKFAVHLIERYGKEEIALWPFEVWNEPNLNFFFNGTQEEYFTLYEETARTLKSVDPCFRVGGPATSVNAWIPEFRAYCEKNEVPLDFITTHHYPSDDPLSNMGMNGPGTKGKMFDEETRNMLQAMPPEKLQEIVAQMFARPDNKNPRDILAQMTKKAKEESGEYPLYYTEWNGSREFDTSYQAAMITQTIAYNEGLVEGYSFWTVSDIFEEMGMKPGPFKNEFGIQTNHGIAKPSYRVFETLHQAGCRRLSVDGSHRTAEILALKDDQFATIMVYNHDLERRDIQSEAVSLTLKGKVKSISMAVIDEGHCNPQQAWVDMGSPEYLKKDQIEILEKASQLIFEDVKIEGNGAEHLMFTSLPESVTIIKVEL